MRGDSSTSPAGFLGLRPVGMSLVNRSFLAICRRIAIVAGAPDGAPGDEWLLGAGTSCANPQAVDRRVNVLPSGPPAGLRWTLLLGERRVGVGPPLGLGLRLLGFGLCACSSSASAASASAASAASTSARISSSSTDDSGSAASCSARSAASISASSSSDGSSPPSGTTSVFTSTRTSSNRPIGIS